MTDSIKTILEDERMDDSDIIDLAYSMKPEQSNRLEHNQAIWIIEQLLRIREGELEQLNNLLGNAT